MTYFYLKTHVKSLWTGILQGSSSFFNALTILSEVIVAILILVSISAEHMCGVIKQFFSLNSLFSGGNGSGVVTSKARYEYILIKKV